MTALTKNELHQLIAGATNDYEEIDACGTKVKVRGVTTREYFIHIVRRFPSVLAMLTMGNANEAKLRRAAAAAKAQSDLVGEPFDIDAFKRSFEPDNSTDEAAFLQGQIESGLEEKAAFIACGLGHPGDRAVEAIVLQMREEMFDALLQAIERLTYGGDPQSFFLRVVQNVPGVSMGLAQPIGSAAAQLSAS